MRLLETLHNKLVINCELSICVQEEILVKDTVNMNDSIWQEGNTKSKIARQNAKKILKQNKMNPRYTLTIWRGSLLFWPQETITLQNDYFCLQTCCSLSYHPPIVPWSLHQFFEKVSRNLNRFCWKHIPEEMTCSARSLIETLEKMKV